MIYVTLINVKAKKKSRTKILQLADKLLTILAAGG